MAGHPTPTQARRIFLAGAAATMALLAGCATAPSGPLPPIALPGGNGPPLPDAPRNVVAVVVPLTGAEAGIGQSIANAAKLALIDSGERSLRLTVYDSEGPGGAAGATQRALAAGSGLILGPLLAADVRAAAPVARRSGVPLIAFSNDEAVAGGGVYIMGFTPDQSIGRAVDYVRGKGGARFGALVPSGLYGQRATAALMAAVKDAGGRVGAIETFDRSATSARAAAGRLNAKGPFDAVLVGDSGRIAGLVAPSVHGGRIVGTELWASDHGLGAIPALRGAIYAAAPDDRFNQLATRYRAQYGRAPFRLASLGYDAVLLAVRSAKGWASGRPFPARTLVDPDGFSGVDGNFRFGREGVAERLLEVRQVTAAGTVVVAKAETRF